MSEKIMLTDAERQQLNWRKAMLSTNNGACVEVAAATGKVVVRDSKDPDGHVLVYMHSEWNAFLDGAKNGEFDDLAT